MFPDEEDDMKVIILVRVSGNDDSHFLRYKKTEILPLPNIRGFSVFFSMNMPKEEKERENFEW